MDKKLKSIFFIHGFGLLLVICGLAPMAKNFTVGVASTVTMGLIWMIVALFFTAQAYINCDER